MNALFNSALKQSTSIRKDLSSFSSSASSNNPSAALQGQISTTLINFARTLDDYQNLANNELNADKKEKAVERVKNFRGELSAFRAEFDELKRQREDAVAVNNRTELLGRRPHHAATPENPYAQSSNAYGGGASGSGANNSYAGSGTNNSYAGSGASNPYASPNFGGAHASPFAPTHRNTQDGLSFGGAGAGDSTTYTREENALREQNFFSSANAQIDEFLDRGRAVLGDLGQQRDILKGTQRRLYSVGNTLGISGDTIRMVERRAKQDKWIFWTGVAVFFGFCFLVIRYLR